MSSNNVQKTKPDATHARMDPAHCTVPGLFRSQKRGHRTGGTDITYPYNENETLQFIGGRSLGPDDLRVLQGIVALTGPNGKRISASPKSPAAVGIRNSLGICSSERESAEIAPVSQDQPLQSIRNEIARYSESVPQPETLGAQIPITRFLGEIGLSHSGENLASLRECLTRLATTSVVYTQRIFLNGRRRVRFTVSQLISIHYDEVSGKMHVGINPRLAEAVLGNRPHCRLEMNEVRAIKSAPMRLIHARLCGWIDPGQTKPVRLDTLCSYVWPESATPVTTRQRKVTVRRRLLEFKTLGWKFHEYAEGKYEVSRPPTRRPVATSMTSAPA